MNPTQDPEYAAGFHVLPDVFDQAALGRGIEARQGFVDDQQVRRLEQCAGETELLPLARRQPAAGDADVVTQSRLDDILAQAERLHHVDDQRVDFLLRESLTVGELAEMYNGQGWLHDGKRCKLFVAKMDGWNRHMWYDQTGLKWIKPSPNMPTLATATVYTGTCIFEGTNISEGRGTDKPFEYIGSPWLNAKKVAADLNKLKLKGVEFKTLEITPTMRPNNAYPPKYNNQKCNEVYVKVTNRNEFEPVRAGMYLLWAIRKDDPAKFKFKNRTFDRLCGTTEVRRMLEEGKTPKEIFASWEKDLKHFKELREKYLLYK